MTKSDRWVRPIEVRALAPYRIWLRYDDGIEGEVDLSDLAGDGCSELGRTLISSLL